MDVVEVRGDRATVTLASSELAWLSNAINETREAVGEWELQSRTGATAAEYEQLASQVRKLLDRLSES